MTLEAVDSADKCQPSAGIVQYLTIGQPCRWDFVYKDGHVAYEEDKDQNGKLLCGVAYYRDTTSKGPQVQIIGTVVGSNGFPTLETHIRAVQVYFDALGKETRCFYYDSENRHIRDPQLFVFGTAYEYDDPSGRKSKVTSLDQNGNAMPDSAGITSWSYKYKYDSAGNLIAMTATALDTNGVPTLRNKGHYSIVRYRYDQWGNETEHRFFDVDNKTPVADWTSGVHTVKIAHDDQGNAISTTNFDVHGG